MRTKKFIAPKMVENLLLGTEFWIIAMFGAQKHSPSKYFIDMQSMANQKLPLLKNAYVKAGIARQLPTTHIIEYALSLLRESLSANVPPMILDMTPQHTTMIDIITENWFVN